MSRRSGQSKSRSKGAPRGSKRSSRRENVRSKSSTPAPVESAGAGHGLNFGDFRRIASHGIEDPANAYCHGMEYFDGCLYVGTTRNSMALLKLFPPIDPPALDPWPVSVPSSVEELDMQGQIYRWSPATESWQLCYRSPLIIGKNGKEVPRDLGYRGMVKFQGRSDPKPALYASTMSTVLRGCGAHVLKSYDGLEWELASEEGIGNPDISTFRELIAFDGHLYAPPAGEGVTFNSNRRSVVMRSSDPRAGNWEEGCVSGFGDPTNNGIFMMAEFNDHLYAGTFNNFEGYQVWKTKANGGGPCEWKKVIDRGAYRGPLSEIAMAMCPFNGALYIGSSIQNGGYDRYNLVGPASGEIIRLWPDDSWDLIMGQPRQTPDGMKYPLSGIGPGFDNIFSGYIWRMCVHDGWLYATTFDWSVFLHFAHRASPTARRLVRGLTVEQLNEVGGGFELWRTRDGVNWVPVSCNGMGNPYNYGGRTMISSPDGLFVGTANPFSPESPAKTASRWTYTENFDGGTEVWLGKTPNDTPWQDGDGGADRETPTTINLRSPQTSPDAELIAMTGGSGYVGRRVLDRLLQAGHSVRVLALPGTEADLPSEPRLEIVTGSLEDAGVMARLVDGASIICHFAARLAGSCPRSELRRTNVDGTHALLRAIVGAEFAGRFVLSSSVAVYQGQFDQRGWPISEASGLKTDGGDDLSDYGMTKIASENLVRHYARYHRFGYAIGRYALIYGVGDPLVDRLVREQAPQPWFGQGPAGEQPRQYLHVDDAVEGTLRLIFHEKAANQVFNFAGADMTSYRDIGRHVRRLLGVPTLTDLTPVQERQWRRYQQQYAIGKAKRLLGFTPAIPIQDGIQQILESARAAAPTQLALSSPKQSGIVS